MNPTILVFDWLDKLKFGRFHAILTTLIGLIFIAGGYNSQVVAYIVPLALKEWHLTPLAAGTMMSASHCGLMLGAIGFGMASDRIGRKKTIMLAVASLSVFSSAAYFAPNYEVFCLLRLIAGLGDRRGGAALVNDNFRVCPCCDQGEASYRGSRRLYSRLGGSGTYWHGADIRLRMARGAPLRFPSCIFASRYTALPAGIGSVSRE